MARDGQNHPTWWFWKIMSVLLYTYNNLISVISDFSCQTEMLYINVEYIIIILYM